MPEPIPQPANAALAAAPILQYDRPQPAEITRAHLRTGRVFFALAAAVGLDAIGTIVARWFWISGFSLSSPTYWWPALGLNNLFAISAAVASAVLTGFYVRRGSHVAATTAKWLALALGLYGLAGTAPLFANLLLEGPAATLTHNIRTPLGPLFLLPDVCLALFAFIALRHAWHIRPARSAVIANFFLFRSRLAAAYMLALTFVMFWLVIDLVVRLVLIANVGRAGLSQGLAITLYLSVAAQCLWPIAGVAIMVALRKGSLTAVWLALGLLLWPILLMGLFVWVAANIISESIAEGSSLWAALQEIWRGSVPLQLCQSFLVMLPLVILCSSSLIRAAFAARRK